MDDRFADLDQQLPPSGVLGYLNFSQGRPDPRWQKQLNDAYAFLAERGVEAPWQELRDWLRDRLETLQASGAAAFRDVTQVRAVLALVFDRLLPAYRQHHADLLAHLSDRDLFAPFFLVRVCEVVLAQGPPWDEDERIVSGALTQLNDFLGYRPIAVLENRPRGEPYDHERVRPIPLYLKGAGVAWGRYRDLIGRALDILNATEPNILAEAEFDPRLLDELALDPRAYDHGHPVNRRPNYVFGEWDPHHIDNQGHYRRFVVRQVILDALLERVAQAGTLDQVERLREAAGVLVGTMLMAAGISGSGPTAHDSTATLGRLMPGIARYREAFYAGLLQRLPAPHAERLRQEAAATRQPFGAARQQLNQYLTHHRAAQMQQRCLAIIFAEMGYADASRREAAQIEAASVRLFDEVVVRLNLGWRHLERGELADAARLLPECEELLHRGIRCGAFADPWNILGFQGLFPLSPAREDSIRDTRIDELLRQMQQCFTFASRLLSEAGASGNQALAATVKKTFRRVATWWDQFASVEVSGVARVHGGEALAAAEHVATALARWHERGEATADLAFWRQHLEGFRTPKAFWVVVDALLRKQDHRAAMALLMNWLGQAEQVPLDDSENYSFHSLALHWFMSLAGENLPDSSATTWPLIVKFFDHLEVNAEEYWQVPDLAPEMLHMPRAADEADEDDVYGAAYEGVTFRDSADDSEEGSVADGGPQQEFLLEARSEEIGRRLRFLGTLARLWMLAVQQDSRLPPDAARTEQLASWLTIARQKHEQLLTLLDALHAQPVPQPLGSEESLVEFDRRRNLQEFVLYQAINTCHDVEIAVAALHGGACIPLTGSAEEQPAWRPLWVLLEQAVLRGDVAAARAQLPRFLESFQQESLLFVGLADGGQPRQILRARFAQTMLRLLLIGLPGLGLLRETYHVLKTARAMEQAHPVGKGGVSGFDQRFQEAFQFVVERVVLSAEQWPEPHGNAAELVEITEKLTAPFLALWQEHSRSLQLSPLESLRSEADWQELRAFIQRYGADLFHVRFMTLGNLRGILHRGVDAYLDYLRDNPDPLHPIRLIEDLENGLPREPAVRHLQLVLRAVVENYEEYKDYNTTTTQSDYGQHLHLLLEFLRLKASYDRHAWQLRPVVQAHEVLARSGRTTAAVLWQEAVTRSTRALAAQYLEALANLERTHGLHLETVADRLGEQFVRPLALDRLCALIEPAMEEVRAGEECRSFAELEEELRTFAALPSGVGLEVPQWLRRLEMEVQRVHAAQTTLAGLAEDQLQSPERLLSVEELQEQLQDWDKPLS